MDYQFCQWLNNWLCICAFAIDFGHCIELFWYIRNYLRVPLYILHVGYVNVDLNFVFQQLVGQILNPVTLFFFHPTLRSGLI